MLLSLISSSQPPRGGIPIGGAAQGNTTIAAREENGGEELESLPLEEEEESCVLPMRGRDELRLSASSDSHPPHEMTCHLMKIHHAPSVDDNVAVVTEPTTIPPVTTTTTTTAAPTASAIDTTGTAMSESRDYDPESPPFEPQSSYIDPFSTIFATPLSSPEEGSVEVDLEEEKDTDTTPTTTTTIAPPTTTTTTATPVVKQEPDVPDWNDVHQQGEELRMPPHQRRFENRPLETRVLLLDPDSENETLGDEQEIGREITIKKEPSSEDEEDLGFDWSKAHGIRAEELEARERWDGA